MGQRPKAVVLYLKKPIRVIEGLRQPRQRHRRELRQGLCQQDEAEIDFIEGRRAEIRDQIRRLIYFQESTDLTVIGTEFVRSLLTDAQRRWAGDAKLRERPLHTL